MVTKHEQCSSKKKKKEQCSVFCRVIESYVWRGLSSLEKVVGYALPFVKQWLCCSVSVNKH